MSDMILYHYALSPFSEKIRAMLGYTGMSWESVTVPEMPPRPQLDRLAGGYRRVPVAQMGADILCDSKPMATGQQPRPLPIDNQDDERMGRFVSISPSDYGKDPVNGVLVANLAHSWILQRKVNGSSTVHVHFPKQGFSLQPE